MKRQTTVSTDSLESVTKTAIEFTSGDLIQLFTEQSNLCNKQIKCTTIDSITYNNEVVQHYTRGNDNVRFLW